MSTLLETSEATAALAETTARRIVAIDTGHRSAASGIIWRKDLIVTASEALGDDERFELLRPDGSVAAATLAGRDPSTDIALLRTETEMADPFKAATIAKAGQFVLAVGRSSNGALASAGIVKEAGGSWHSFAGGQIDRRILLDLALDRCAHGGGVVDAHGDLIGLAAFAPRHQALVIPIETVDRIAERLAASGRVSRGYLGVGLHPVRLGEDRSGVMVVQIDDASPAGRAGLFAGDIITTWNGEAIGSARDVFRKLGPDTVGTTAALDIIRANQPARVDVAIGERRHT